MKSLRINIILPFLTTRPNGGVKIMYEYANRLQERGHTVTVLHSIQRPYRKIKSPVWWKQLMYKVRGLSRPPWFPLHEQIRSLVVPQITDRFVPDADISMSTWWEMTYMISRLSASKGRPFNLIQDHEVWKGHEDLVHGSYRLPVRHLVIARYLQTLVEKHSGITPVHIPNAIDLKRFQLTQPIESRDPLSIIMLYSSEERKGSVYGIQALAELKKKYPTLKADLFGVFEKPELPSWINYHHKPSDLAGLMNRNAIFFSPSLGEGWALPPAEAMACGCAVVCTDIGGHADYAIEKQTALLTTPKDIADSVQKLEQVLDDQGLRFRLARAGYEFITGRFSWEASIGKIEAGFYGEMEG